MPDRSVPLTKEGLAKLQEELDYLRNVRRPQVAERIHQSKELASTQNNAEYDDAKNEQAFVEGRILTLERIIQNAVLIDEEEAHHASRVQVGSDVVVLDENGEKRTFTIVGFTEADPKVGKISNESPVGRALLGHRKGDVVEVVVPAGVKKLTILEIK